MSYLIVTSRSPISHEKIGGNETMKKNVGGVVTALSRAMKQDGGTWVCWGDGNLDGRYPDENYDGYRIVRVFMSSRERKGFYDDYANGTLWPLFHYFRDRMKLTSSGMNYYRQINEKYADAVVRNVKAGQRIWIHDYQLALLPKMLRERGIENQILMTWHIPWVASEFYATLPEAKELLEGIIASDMITFHTELYKKNFLESCDSLLGKKDDVEGKLFVFSLGIDTSYYSGNPANRQNIELKNNRKLILSIDRLDYTKGLVNRALAIENLVRRYPDDARKFTYVMIVTPSRTSVAEYINMKRDLEMTVGRINGSYSDLTWQPILYLYRRVTDRQLMNYYRSANVALIAPLIDGLNLVSKEFVAATRNGVLILSRFAGASFSLGAALKVNPYDLNEVADKLHDALHMNENEIKFRLESMKENVMKRDINWWLAEISSTADMLERKLNGSAESIRNTH